VKPIFFIHVTKTAGGSIKRMLREGSINAQFHYPKEEGYEKEFNYPKDLDVIYGHYRFGAHEKMGVDANYACFVREPIARTVSHFYHLKNVAKNAVGDRAREFKDVGTFLANTKNMDLDNLQTRMLSGIGRDVGYQKLDQSAADLAISNLEKHFCFIGIFENLDGSINRLNQLFPALEGRLPPHVNKGKYEHETDDETLDLIKVHNQFDAQVYAAALSLSSR